MAKLLSQIAPANTGGIKSNADFRQFIRIRPSHSELYELVPRVFETTSRLETLPTIAYTRMIKKTEALT